MDYFVQYHDNWPRKGDQPYRVRTNEDPEVPKSEWRRYTVVVPSNTREYYSPLTSKQMIKFFGTVSVLPEPEA